MISWTMAIPFVGICCINLIYHVFINHKNHKQSRDVAKKKALFEYKTIFTGLEILIVNRDIILSVLWEFLHW